MPEFSRITRKALPETFVSTGGFVWSGRRGSNSLPPPWQGGALPDELRPHIPFVFAGLLSGDVGYYTAHSGSCQPQNYIFLKKNVF